MNKQEIADRTFESHFADEVDFKHSFWFEKDEPETQSIVIMEPHTDDWIDLYIGQQLGGNYNYFHKNRLPFMIMGNWDNLQNKKDMKYNTNSVNHLWMHSITPIECNTIINTIKGTTVWAVWDFEYLLDALVYNSNSSINTKFVTFDLKKDAQAYLKKYIDLAKHEVHIQNAFDILAGYSKGTNMILRHKPFKQIHKIQIPTDINVVALDTYIDTMATYFKPIMKDTFLSNLDSSDFDNFWSKNADTKEQTVKYYEDYVVTPAYSKMWRTKKKVVQNNIAGFKQLLLQETA